MKSRYDLKNDSDVPGPGAYKLDLKPNLPSGK